MKFFVLINFEIFENLLTRLHFREEYFGMIQKILLALTLAELLNRQVLDARTMRDQLLNLSIFL